jgi:hypothetical protein
MDNPDWLAEEAKELICQATFKEHCQFPKCDCDREPEHPDTCRCEVCRFWS